MNDRDKAIARGLLFLVTFAALSVGANWALGMAFPQLAGTYPYVLYSISAFIALLLSLAAVQHFFPRA